MRSIINEKNLKNKKFFFIHFGFGSGCIGLSLLSYFKKAHLLALDESPKAVQITKRNARRLKLNKRVQVFQKNVLSLKIKNLPETPIFITANPPYIANEDPYIEPAVKDFEPHKALFSGPKGTEAIESWLNQALKLLKAKAKKSQELYYFFEIGFNQEPLISRLLKNHPDASSFAAYPDIQGYKRAFAVKVKNEVKG